MQNSKSTKHNNSKIKTDNEVKLFLEHEDALHRCRTMLNALETAAAPSAPLFYELVTDCFETLEILNNLSQKMRPKQKQNNCHATANHNTDVSHEWEALPTCVLNAVIGDRIRSVKALLLEIVKRGQPSQNDLIINIDRLLRQTLDICETLRLRSVEDDLADQNIWKAVNRHVDAWTEINSLPATSDVGECPTGKKLLEEINELEKSIASTVSAGLMGLQAKASWLMQLHNFNDGEFSGSNQAVLKSLLKDITRLES